MKVPLEAVGKNLGDHPLLYITDFSANETSLFPKITSADMEIMFDEYHNGDGILSKVSQGPLCFIASTKATSNWPDLWIQINPQVSVDGEGESITFFNILGRPQSKGVLSLDTEKYKAGVRDDVELALIDSKLLTHPDDMEAFLEGTIICVTYIWSLNFTSIHTIAFTSNEKVYCRLTYTKKVYVSGIVSIKSSLISLTNIYFSAKIIRKYRAKPDPYACKIFKIAKRPFVSNCFKKIILNVSNSPTSALFYIH